MMRNKKDNYREMKSFFKGIVILCFFLALIILAMMLHTTISGNVISSGAEIVPINESNAYILSGENGENYIHENFFKHFMRDVLDSFEEYIQF